MGCKKIITILSMFLFAHNLFAMSSFVLAKKTANELFNNNRITLYCGCQYSKHKKINLDSCGMQSAKKLKRAHSMEWEHMMPVEHFGKHLPCWHSVIYLDRGVLGTKKLSGRKLCGKIDSQFNTMEGELYNLWPAVGLANQARSNFRYSMIAKHYKFYGCDLQIDAQQHKIEPADKAKGIVARANLFMSDNYNIKLSSSQRKLFLLWNKQFPPSSWEINWAMKIAEIQGYTNPWITKLSS